MKALKSYPTNFTFKMIPWELFSYRLFKTVIFLVLLLCCLMPATDSRPLEAEAPEDWDSNQENLEKPKTTSSSRITEETSEFGSKIGNKNTTVVRIVVSSSSSSDSEGEFSGFPAFQFISSSTTTTEKSPSSRTNSPVPSPTGIKTGTTAPEVNRSVIRGQGQNTRYFLRPKRISTFTAKTGNSTLRATTPTMTAKAKPDLSTSSPEEENMEKESEKIEKTKKEDIFSAFYRVFSSKSNVENRSSSLAERESENNDSFNENDNSPVMSDSQNVERFQVYPQLIRSRIELAYNSNHRKSSNNRKTLAVDRSSNNKSETLDGRGFGPEAKVVSVVTHTKSVAVNTHRSSKHVITNSRPLPVRVRPIYQPKPAETAIESVSVPTLKNSNALKKNGLAPIIASNSSPRSNNVSPIAQALIQDYNPITYSTITTNTPITSTQIITTPKTIATTTQKLTSASWHQPEQNWGEAAQVWGSPSKVWSEPEKIWGEPARVWSEPSQPSWLQPDSGFRIRSTTVESILSSTTLPPVPVSEGEKGTGQGKSSLEDEDEEVKNSQGQFFQLGEDEEDEMENDGGKSSWELPELSPQVDHTFVGGRVSVPSLNNNKHSRSSVSYSSNSNNNKQLSSSNNSGNSRRFALNNPGSNRSSNNNGVGSGRGTSSSVDGEKEKSGKKFGYVLEGADVRKYRVEERTPDGYIVGEYGVLNNENGFLRGVRYTADGTINPRLIHEALMKFLAL